MKKRIVGLALAAAISGTVMAAVPASAATSGRCTDGYVCFYYNSNHGGAKAKFSSNVSNLAGYTFDSSGAGAGVAVKNNAASAEYVQSGCSASNCYARVYFNSGYLGLYDQVGAGSWRNLADTYNNNASLEIFNPL